MQVVYDKDGNAHSREPIDAREMIASGHYFASNPTQQKAGEAGAGTEGAAGNGATGATGGNAGNGGSAPAGLKPIDEITVAEIKGLLDERHIPIPDDTRKKQELYDLLASGGKK